MLRRSLVIVLLLLVGACSLQSRELPVLPLAEDVDLERFMGAWYVIGFIPLYPEKDAHNGVEHYQRGDDGRILTTYRFREGAFDGELATYLPSAEVVPDTGNAIWRMQFIWPFSADYRIAWLSADYGEVIVAREARDYVWLMARDHTMSDERFSELRRKIAEMGYDIGEFRRQPQRWPEAESRPARPPR